MKALEDPRYNFQVDTGQEDDKFDQDLINLYLKHKEWAADNTQKAREKFLKWCKNKKAKDAKWIRKRKMLSYAFDSWTAVKESSVTRWNKFIECGSMNEVELKFTSKKVCTFLFGSVLLFNSVPYNNFFIRFRN